MAPLLPSPGSRYRVRRPFQGLQAGTELTVHAHQRQKCGRRLVLMATKNGATSTRVGGYYMPIALLPVEVAELLEQAPPVGEGAG